VVVHVLRVEMTKFANELDSVRKGETRMVLRLLGYAYR
jgi:hypothetical protein